MKKKAQFGYFRQVLVSALREANIVKFSPIVVKKKT